MLKVLSNMNTILKKIKSPLTNIEVYDLETLNKIRVNPYCSCIYKLSNVSGKYNRDISEKKIKNV